MNTAKNQQDTLLIIDDTPDNINILLKLLTISDFRVLIAQDGRHGLQRAERMQPDLILLDIMMPDINGFSVCQELKKNPKTRDIPIIFMTALSDIEDKVMGFELGAADYITKPFQNQEVLSRINTHLNLYKLQKQLRLNNEELQEEIRIRKQTELSLQETTTLLQQRTAELETRNIELHTFSRTVAHDLKSPLNAVINFAGALAEMSQFEPPKDLVERLQIIEQSGIKMLNIIDALLLLAGVSQRTPKIQPLNMEKIMQQVLQRLELMIQDYDATLVLPDCWVMSVGYPIWIEEVWVNYLSNGIKYGGKSPRLLLGSELVNAQMARFWVRDYGMGLNKEAQTRLFTPFTRLNENATEGHGLGLSIVRQIIHKLEGDIGVESEVGKGSLFYFTLPAC